MINCIQAAFKATTGKESSRGYTDAICCFPNMSQHFSCYRSKQIQSIATIRQLYMHALPYTNKETSHLPCRIIIPGTERINLRIIYSFRLRLDVNVEKERV